ncbi:MAG: tetratricopeptide repeat protein, partial [Opitutaceae bacterium]|nr:tetratricopeptide repeat protein [Opitutaceae bacterium]
IDAGGRLAAPGAGRLGAVLAASGGQAGPASREGFGAVRAFVDQSFEQGNPLDGLLALLEHNLQTGPAPEAAITATARYRDLFNTDPQCRLYLSAVGQSPNPGRLDSALRTLASIDRSRLRKGYFIGAQVAAILLAQEKREDAREVYLTVLENNPVNAGVLKDLGSLYLNLRQTPEAWACWDAARRLYPEHVMLRQVADYEATLEKAHPEFFAPGKRR